MVTISKLFAQPIIALIWLYQRLVSLDHGPLKAVFPYGVCKFYPTCSEFAKQVLKQEGLLGTKKIIKRLLSCTPGSLGGVNLP